MSNIVHTMYLRPIMVSESYHLVISSCVAYMPIMMGGVSVYSAVYSYLAMQGPGTNNRFVPSDIGYCGTPSNIMGRGAGLV